MGKFNEYSQKATPADNDTLMIYDASLAFTTDGENAIKFLVNDEEKWKVVVK